MIFRWQGFQFSTIQTLVFVANFLFMRFRSVVGQIAWLTKGLRFRLLAFNVAVKLKEIIEYWGHQLLKLYHSMGWVGCQQTMPLVLMKGQDQYLGLNRLGDTSSVYMLQIKRYESDYSHTSCAIPQRPYD